MIAGDVSNTLSAARGAACANAADLETYIPVLHAELSPALKARDSKGPSSDGDGDGDGAILVPMVSHALRSEGFDASEDGTGRGTPLVPIAFAQNQMGEVRTSEVVGTLNTNANANASGRNTPMAMNGTAVRRLTPREGARLQGFPDDYLDITFSGKPASDAAKYKALGNSMAVNCMRWIGARIQMVDAIEKARAAA